MADTETCPDLHDLELLAQGKIRGPAARALEQHLRRCRACADRLRRTASPSFEGRTVGAAGGTLGPEEMHRQALRLLSPAAGPDELGRLGRYRVLRVLGAGGMGIVLEAEDTALGRPVALKVMKAALAGGGTAHQRFLQEARATAALVHDHVVTIHDVDEASVGGGPGESDGRVPFLAMQLLQGETLEARLARPPSPSVAEVLRIGREIAAGLAAAHQRGLIHRDIKPANVWLEAPAGRVKILDFGLVRAAGVADPATDGPGAATREPLAGDERLTQDGAIVGTPAYMAPEQAKGTGAVDARSDLFSLGCVLYRLGSGRGPFQAADTAGTLLAVATHQPPPPASLNPALPPGLSELIMRLLAKRAEDRPASAGQVVEALAALEQDLAGRGRRRHWPVLAAAAGLLLALGLAAYWLRPTPPPDPGPKAPPSGSSERPALRNAPTDSQPRYPRAAPDTAEVVAAINRTLRALWAREKITPSAYINDYQFIRRASLDIIGRIATPLEFRRFFADPPDKRRALLIDRLLASPEYARYWGERWSGWLVDRTGAFGRGVYHDQLTAWLEARLAQNAPYHEFVRGLLTAQGRNIDHGAVNFTLAHLGEPVPPRERADQGQYTMVPLTGRIARVFLGVRLACAQCHDHPYLSSIKQEDFWAVNGFLRQVERQGEPDGEPSKPFPVLTVADNAKAARGMTTFEKVNRVVRVAKRPELRKLDLLGSTIVRTPRAELADALIKLDMFPRAITNRMWAAFFGKGFFGYAVDDFRETGALGEKELLDGLAVRLKQHNYDLRKLIRWICNSEAYHLSSAVNRTNHRPYQAGSFSRMGLKPLSPEQLFDSVQVATGGQLARGPQARAARDVWLGRHYIRRNNDEGNEIDLTGTLEQALICITGSEINDAIARKGEGTVAKAVARHRGAPRAVITELYLVALNRPPTPKELGKLQGAGRLTDDFYEDLFWALLNTSEFVLNH
jgi:serine/threonine protein kinase